MTLQAGPAHHQGISPPPSLDDILATPSPDGLIGRVDFSTRLMPEPEPEPEPQPEPQPQPEPRREPDPEPDPTPVLLPARAPVPLTDELPHLARSVDEVACTVIELMQRAGEAHLRHLEAIESETARRCELVTARAELDAELIRLQARREAHGVLSAAGAHTGDVHPAETRVLSHVSASFSRFAESLAAGAAPTSTHDPRDPQPMTTSP